MQKGIIKFLLLFSLFLSVCTVGIYGYLQWRKQVVYEDKITITAYYMKYACGDCSIDMKVESIDNSKYNFIIGKDIFPTPQNKPVEDLCDYVSSIGYESSTGPDYIEEPFVLVGQLHKYAHEWPWESCSGTAYFTVEKLKYGIHGKWIQF